MKILSLLIILVIVAYLVSKQLTPASSAKNTQTTTTENKDIVVPKVPTAPQDLKKFKTDINKFIEDSATKRNKALD